VRRYEQAIVRSSGLRIYATKQSPTWLKPAATSPNMLPAFVS
jgi:hypothetical protein